MHTWNLASTAHLSPFQSELPGYIDVLVERCELVPKPEVYGIEKLVKKFTNYDISLEKTRSIVIMNEITSGASVSCRRTFLQVSIMGPRHQRLPFQHQSQALPSEICAYLYLLINHQLHTLIIEYV